MPCNHIARLLISIETKKIRRLQQPQQNVAELTAELNYKSSQVELL